VLANLPAMLVLRPGELGGEPWATASLRLLSMEADLNGQGANGILARLLEIVLLQAVRRMASAQDGAVAGYMAALSDAQLSRALLAIHKEPDVAWKIQDLAELAGMSRARFADRFTAVVGMAPIGYLTAWRLIKARAMLAGCDLAMDVIADRCGYASVPSFTRRFKKTFGVGPGTYRRLSRSV
jgi:transcriptional regulator GlxA family with amidase domain